MVLDEAALIGLFSYRQPRARCVPSLNDFPIGSLLRTDPFEEIEDQSAERICHACNPRVVSAGLEGSRRQFQA